MEIREQKKNGDPNKRRPDDDDDDVDDKVSTRIGTEKDDKEISLGEN